MVRTMSEGRDGQLRCQPPCPWRCCHPHPLSLAREGPKTLSPQMEWMGGWTGGWMGGGRPRDTAKATGLKQNRAGPQPSHCGHAVSTSEQVWSCADTCVRRRVSTGLHRWLSWRWASTGLTPHPARPPFPGAEGLPGLGSREEADGGRPGRWARTAECAVSVSASVSVGSDARGPQGGVERLNPDLRLAIRPGSRQPARHHGHPECKAEADPAR